MKPLEATPLAGNALKSRVAPQDEIKKLKDRVKFLEQQTTEAERVITLLIAADLVSEDKVGQARSLAFNLR